MLKTLLLNSSYEVLNFITDRKAFKLLFSPKNKVEVIASWDNNDIIWSNGRIKHPAILRLNKHIKRNYFSKTNFSRKALIKRDNSTCQFCNKKLIASQITVDHVIPKSQNGATSFTNCVICCHHCNNKKADKTPEQAGMKLLKNPISPAFISFDITDDKEFWHSDWNLYLNIT